MMQRARKNAASLLALLLATGAHTALGQSDLPKPPDIFLPAQLPAPAPAPAITSLTRLYPGYLDTITSSLNLVACDDDASRFAGLPTNAVALIEDAHRGCAVWNSPASPTLNSFLAFIEVGATEVPLVGYTNKAGFAQSSPLVILDLVGGPAGDISPGLNDTLQEALARRGALVLKPAYAGTRHRSHYPAPELDQAVGETIATVRHLRRARPDARVVLMGESLGGYVAARALSITPDLPIDGLVLVLPLVYSPVQALQNFEQQARGAGEAFTPLWIRNERGRVAKRSTQQDTSTNNYRAISSRDLFEAYFPADARSTGLLVYLQTARRIPTLVAYGALDSRVGVELLQGASALPDNVHLLRLGRSAHELDATAADKIAAVTWSTFARSRDVE